MARLDYGWNVDIDDFISRVLDSLPRLVGVNKKIALQDLYETEFGIFNHLDGVDRPLASVAFFECEDFTSNSKLGDVASEFITKEIYNFYGISLLDFLDLPRATSEVLLKVADDHFALKKKARDAAEDEFGKELK